MAKDWDFVRDDNRNLYIVRGLPLREVMRVVKGKTGFVALSYRTQLLEWGYTKYSTDTHPKPKPNVNSGNQHSFRRRARGAAMEIVFVQADGSIGSTSTALPPLLLSGIAVDAKDHAGNEPLHHAALAGEVEIVQYLLRFGANPDAAGHFNKAPLHLATSHLEIVELLLKEGADASGQDGNGDTPLHVALSAMTLQSKDLQLVAQCFLEAGSDVNRPNRAGTTPFSKLLAMPMVDGKRDKPQPRTHFFELVAMFLEYGGNHGPWWRLWLNAVRAGQSSELERFFNLKLSAEPDAITVAIANGTLVDELIRKLTDQGATDPAEKRREQKEVAQLLRICRSSGYDVDRELAANYFIDCFL
ncbi:hypothetical protein VTK73DRAFT_6881 [Phialemonium thermophilum]|uniref:Clr5 domain-containing protein n=1 Tax=Phialemonium thermophilum TaxID=223376 RepID=A0ABR3WID8_9PEZI